MTSDTKRFGDVRGRIFRSDGSKVERYMDLVVGRRGWAALLAYETIVLFTGGIRGALGLALRSWLYPLLLGSCGRGVVFGANVSLRHPHKIRLGDDVVVDDNCVLDAKGEGNRGITVGNRVFIGRNSILTCKDGDLEIGDDVSIGFNCTLFSGSKVRVGSSTLVAAYCFLVGGGHEFDGLDIPVIEQDRPSKGIEMGDNVWLGAHVTVLDGVRVGSGAIVGAASVVGEDVPEGTIVAGAPARVIRQRAVARMEEIR